MLDDPRPDASPTRDPDDADRADAPARDGLADGAVDPALAQWRPPRPPTRRERMAGGALAAAMQALGQVLEPSKNKEDIAIEAEAPGDDLDDPIQLQFDPDDPKGLVVVLPPVPRPDEN